MQLMKLTSKFQATDLYIFNVKRKEVLATQTIPILLYMQKIVEVFEILRNWFLGKFFPICVY